MKDKRIILIAIGIFLLAAFLRFYGVNWDANQHLHPDERFLTMVTSAIAFPANIGEYLDTSISPLNPHNKGFNFFVYGTFPLFFTKWVSEYLGKTDYNNLTLIGRQLSALFDLGTVLLVFLIAKHVIPTELKRAEGSLANARRSNKLRDSSTSLGMTIRNNWVIGLFAAFLYATMVLPIQLSHFYAVDTYLTFFITLSFYLLIKIIYLPRFTFLPLTDSRSSMILSGRKSLADTILNTKYLILIALLGISFGLALASKISAILFLPIILIGLTVYSIRYSMWTRQLILGLLFIISAYFTFRLTQPYLFVNPNVFDITLNPKVLDNWKQLKSFDDVNGGFPPSVQWITTKPYLFPLKNMVLWGLGLPLGIIAVVSILYLFFTVILNIFQDPKKMLNQVQHDKSFMLLILSLLWILLLFFYQGGQFVKALRYFFPIYPFLAILSGFFIYQILKIKNQIHKANIKYKNIFHFLYVFFIFAFLFLILLYPLSFLSIYSRPHSRIAASEWIYQNIPAGSTLSAEHWDDGLPLSLPEKGYIHEKYKTVEFPLYYPDEKEKWELMAQKLAKADYIIMSSNRLYGSIPTFLEKYPVTNKYYWQLFDGSLGFEKVAEFTSRPNIPLPFLKICITPPFTRYGIVAKSSQECPLPGISFVDDYADETFTVYDHPKVLIFKKVRPVDYLSVLY